MEKQPNHEMDEEDLEDLYNWVDGITLSRPKKSIARDFADGVLAAEIVKYFCPRLVELHNYASANSRNKKLENWDLLNRKVFKKLGFELADDVLNKVVNAEPFAIEQVLVLLRRKIDRYVYEQKRNKEKQEKQETQNNVTSVAEKKNKAPTKSGASTVHNGPLSDRPEVDQNFRTFPGQSQLKTEMVPKVTVEEKEQEVLAKEETIQILQAKIRRLEHLVHLKDIRIDDLSNMIKELEENIRQQKVGAPPPRR